MRLALVSDQHGNDVAFRAVAEDLEGIGVDEVVCLGDAVQGGPEPVQTLERLQALGCATVLGNADALLLEVPEDSPEPIDDRLLEVREWTLSRLDESHLAQIRSFEPTVRRTADGFDLLFFHGSPRSYDDVLLPDSSADALEPYRGHGAALLAGGHTHLPWTLLIDGAVYLNPGAVGVARGGHLDLHSIRAVAEYAVVTTGEAGVAVEFRQVPYSADDVRAATARSGRPYADEWAARWRASPRP